MKINKCNKYVKTSADFGIHFHSHPISQNQWMWLNVKADADLGLDIRYIPGKDNGNCRKRIPDIWHNNTDTCNENVRIVTASGIHICYHTKYHRPACLCTSRAPSINSRSQNHSCVARQVRTLIQVHSNANSSLGFQSCLRDAITMAAPIEAAFSRQPLGG